MSRVVFNNVNFSDNQDQDKVEVTSDVLRRRRLRDARPREIDPQEQKRCMLCLCGVIVLIVMLSFSSLLCSGIVIFKMHFPDEEGTAQLCLQLKNKGKSNSLISNLLLTSEGYCANSRSQIDGLFKAIIDIKTKEYGHDMVNDLSSRFLSGKMVYAHVLITGFGDMHDDKRNRGEVKIIKGSKTTRSFGVTLSQYRIVILTSGTYYVYSHVLFNVARKPTFVRQSHKVMYCRHSNSSLNTKILLENKHIFQNKIKTIRSSFIADVFQLKREDEIFVTVSDLNYVSRRKDVNFLGLYLINDVDFNTL